ncbi:MAG TPA: hypothetical protein DC001_03440 [Clostridiales bacterium]|nr:hypothetical protein [Clostridiales bacterium]HBR09455.1 hypothetical protein [Clostridiales bacterium]
MRKFIVEFGLGADFHGQDVTNAAKKAVKDAISRSCLCGLEEVAGIRDLEKQVFIKATVSVSRPEAVDAAAVAAALPVGTAEVFVVKGGLTVDGLNIPALGDNGKSIEAAIAAVEVYIAD